MNGWQEFVSNIVSSAMWPLVVLVLGITFRKTLRSALERTTRFEGLGATIELAETIRRIDIEAGAVAIEAHGKSSDQPGESHSPSTQMDHPVVRASVEQIQDIAGDSAKQVWLKEWRRGIRTGSPTEAIMQSWSRLEHAIVMISVAAANTGLVSPSNPNRGISGAVADLLRADLISQKEHDLIGDMQMTRDAVAHNNVWPSTGQALAYDDAAEMIRMHLLRMQHALVRDEPIERSTE